MKPLYHAIPVLEVADALPAPAPPILDALPVAPEAPPPRPAILDALPVPAEPQRLPVLDALPADTKPTRPAMLALLLRSPWIVASVFEWLFGAVVLMVTLAVLAALPVLQFLSLGYLLEAGARVARGGRLRDGFIGVRLAARLGGIVVACWLFLLPVRFVAGLAHSAALIDPGGKVAAGWRVGLLVLAGLTGFHLACACARGGRLRYFLWPFNFVSLLLRVFRGGAYAEARDAVWDTTMALRLPSYFWLGMRGFAGAMAWLALPVTLLAIGHSPAPGAALVGFLGALLLGLVLLYLPFLQMRLAQTNRFKAVFELGTIRREYRRAPWAFAFAFVVTLLTALPLYLLKIEIVPREAAWLPGLVFIVFIFPARLLTGWALSRAAREAPCHWFFRWVGRIPFVPAAAAYVLVVFFSQYTSWNGVVSLYEQHAFLLPVPFFGM